MNRREFLKLSATSGVAAFASSSIAATGGAASGVPDFAKGAEKMGPILTDSEVRVSRSLAGKKSASYFCDDARLCTIADTSLCSWRTLWGWHCSRECVDGISL